MKNYDIQRKPLTEKLPPREALNVSLIEKGILNHSKLSNNFKSNRPTVHKSHNELIVKRKPNTIWKQLASGNHPMDF